MDISSVMSGFKPRHVVICAALVILANIAAMTGGSHSFITIGGRHTLGPVFVPAPGQARPAPPILIGSPVEGTWGKSRVNSTTPAGNHHLLYKAMPMNQWAVDLPSPSGAAVKFYASTGNAADNSAITASVTQIVDNNACRLGGGGDFVTVGVYFDGVLAGRATYAHLNRDPGLKVGSQIPVAGGTLGTVAYLSGRTTGGSSCWTGPHVHFELRSEGQRACWMRENAAGDRLRRGDALGHVGAVSSLAAACGQA